MHCIMCLYSVLAHLEQLYLAQLFSFLLSKILGMFLRSKSSLLNGNILHLILSLVGTLDSEHECIEIPYPQAFKDLLAGELEPRDSVKQAGEYFKIPPLSGLQPCFHLDISLCMSVSRLYKLV